MIQDIAPKHLYNEYTMGKPRKQDKILAFQERMIYLDHSNSGQVHFLSYLELEEFCRKNGKEIPECEFLFKVDEEAYYLADLAGMEIEKFQYYKMFEIRTMAPMEAVLAGATAYHLFCWYKANQFCGACGKKLVRDKKQRMLSCPACGNMVFPKIAPAVIVGVTNGDKLLMTKYAGREYTRYALIAGFTEIGESAEETVAREVMEEVGVKVKNITYYKSQPWGFDSNLLLGYYAELDDTEELLMDEEELSSAEWVDYHDMPNYQEGLSLTEEMMNHFKEKRRNAE